MENIAQADALLFGRVTLSQRMEAAWRLETRTTAMPDSTEPFARTIDGRLTRHSRPSRQSWESRTTGGSQLAAGKSATVSGKLQIQMVASPGTILSPLCRNSANSVAVAIPEQRSFGALGVKPSGAACRERHAAGPEQQQRARFGDRLHAVERILRTEPDENCASTTGLPLASFGSNAVSAIVL